MAVFSDTNKAKFIILTGVFPTIYAGIWLVHCHIEAHLPWGMAMAFEVENGPTPETTLPPPPADLPTQC